MSKELERLENKNLPCANCKTLKVLKIIKEKGIDIYTLKECKHCKTPKRYNEQAGYFYHEELTKEEFDLLKEILL